MEKGMVIWTVSLHWIYGLIFGIEHMTGDDEKSWMIVVHLDVLRIMLERIEVDNSVINPDD